MVANYFGSTDMGLVRDNNEDVFIAKDILNGRYVLLSVIDGVGGYEGGEEAANIARETIINAFEEKDAEFEEMLREALLFAHHEIQEKKTVTGFKNMSCVATALVADVEEGTIYYGHIGDTRLYLFRDNDLIKVSKDHSFVGYLEEVGRISERSAMNHPNRNQIDKALGLDTPTLDDFIDTGNSAFNSGDIILLCSDGLTDMISANQIISVLGLDQSISMKVEMLIQAAKDAGGKDNVTVVLMENIKSVEKTEMLQTITIEEDEAEEQMSMAIVRNEWEVAKRRPNSNNGIGVLVILIILIVFAILFLLV